MVWYIITKWTEQSERLFTQESLDQMEHLFFIEILNFTKKKKKGRPAGLIETQGRQVADMWLQVSWNRIKTWASSEVLVQIMPGEHFRVQFAGLNKWKDSL